MGGFIVGFDNDPNDIFDLQFDFIQRTGIVTAMVGLLTALPKTKLHERLAEAGRLVRASTGNNTQVSLNFVPVLESAYRTRRIPPADEGPVRSADVLCPRADFSTGLSAAGGAAARRSGRVAGIHQVAVVLGGPASGTSRVLEVPGGGPAPLAAEAPAGGHAGGVGASFPAGFTDAVGMGQGISHIPPIFRHMDLDIHNFGG